MSLDLYLEACLEIKVPLRDGDEIRMVGRDEWNAEHQDCQIPPTNELFSFALWHKNITHNMGRMAKEAGIYETMWRPGECLAAEIVDVLRTGLHDMLERPKHYRTFNPPNGWGRYEDFLIFASEFLDACERYPWATVRASV